MVSVSTKGTFDNLESFLKKASKLDITPILEKYGELGVQALQNNTPIRTGLTASSWYYEIKKDKDGYTIEFNNSNIQNKENIAILIQRGHATRSGSYVEGRDYINPALRPVFENFAKELAKEVDAL